MVKKEQKQDGFMCPGDSGGLFEHIGFEYKTQWTNTDCNTVHGEAQVDYYCEDMVASICGLPLLPSTPILDID